MHWEDHTNRKYLSTLIELRRTATTLRPDVLENWESLARQLLQIGNKVDAITVLAKAVTIFTNEPTLYLLLAEAHYRARQIGDVRKAIHKARSLQPKDRAAAIFLNELLIKTKIAEDVAKVAGSTLVFDPTNIVALTALGKILRGDGKAEMMIPLCEAALKNQPWHTCARYELAMAFAMIGRSADAKKMLNLEQFITVKETETPADYKDARSFAEALTSEIQSNSTLQLDPAGKATRSGSQTMDGLPHSDESAVPALLQTLRSEVDAFESGLQLAETNDAFVSHRPRRARLNSWAVVCGANGRQVSHIHPDGWLSGVYYVAAPQKSSHDRRGCLVLGASEIGSESANAPWAIQNVDPVPGRLVLFPSYVPHCTNPTDSAEPRISVSFDVIPVHS